jgi:stage V sporulation protein AD
MKRIGGDTLIFASRPLIAGHAAAGGQAEGEGPLAQGFDVILPGIDDRQDSWEMAESALLQEAVGRALRAAECAPEDVDLLFGGDLLNQCIATGFAMRETGIPLAGVYGACSTFALALAMAALALESGGFRYTAAAASSHYCAAEKQFRFPLEYGGQSPPSAQRTATAAGAVVLGKPGRRAFFGQAEQGARVTSLLFGRVVDMGLTDANEMGAAMAPAACDTLLRYLRDSGASPQEFDCILTGDLGEIGSDLLRKLVKQEGGFDITPVHKDGGMLLFDTQTQEVGAGASGAGCSAAVLCAEILPRLESGEWNRALFLGTGALLSTTSTQQQLSIPAIAHAVLLTSNEGSAIEK